MTYALLASVGLVIGCVLMHYEALRVIGAAAAGVRAHRRAVLVVIFGVLAALQAPVIMMSQNRAADRDRLAAEVDHEVNVRAELAVRDIDRRLHRIERALGVGGHDLHAANGALSQE